MFGSVRRKSSNVRAMQLFHELKQQFPTLPDHVVSACIANHAHKSDKKDLRETLEVAAAQQEPMGRTLTETSEPALTPTPSQIGDQSDKENKITTNKSAQPQITPLPAAKPLQTPLQTIQQEIPKPERRRRRKKVTNNAMDNKDSNDQCVVSCVRYDKDTDSVESNPSDSPVKVGNSSFFVKRPNTLNLSNVNEASDRNFNNIQPSGRCSDVHKLLNSEIVNSKPPRSPLSSKRFNHKNSPTKGSPRSPCSESAGIRSPSEQSESKKTEPKTVETPTQTTDTLLGNGGCGGGNGGGGGGGGGVSGGLATTPNSPAGVNVSVNVNCSVDVVQSPTRSKCTTSLQVVPQQPWCQEIVSPKSYTSVNLTLRPPSSEPQPPIDITSQNSCLTYSTSSFDPHKGLQSRLQITVGPSGGGVSSMRTRPRSSYHPDNQAQELVPSNRTGSLPDLTDKNKTIIKEQQIRINKLKIELRTEKSRLVAMQREVTELENSENEAEKEKHLQKEIVELQEECKKLTIEVDNRCGSTALPLGETRAIFYDNIYTGQRPLSLGFPTEHITTNHRQRPYIQPPPPPEIEGPKWNCHMCTFQNHPLLDRCEQCEMPRILHGKKQEQPQPSRSRTVTVGSGNYQSLNNNNNNYLPNYHPDGQFLPQYSAGLQTYNPVIPTPYMNQYSCPGGMTLSPRTPNSSGGFLRNMSSPNGYLNQHQMYNSANIRPGLNPVVPSQVYNPFGMNYNGNYLSNGTINSSASSHSLN